MRTRQYLERNLFHTFQDRPLCAYWQHRLQSKWWFKENKKDNKFFAASSLSTTRRSIMFWMYNFWIVWYFSWDCAPQTERFVLRVKLIFTIFQGSNVFLSFQSTGTHLHQGLAIYESTWQDWRHKCSIIFRGENKDCTKSKTAITFVIKWMYQKCMHT
jgi:hypothetical protein